MQQMTVNDIMTRKVTAVPATMPVKEVATLLHDKGITGAPVVDEVGYVIGLVSEFDILSRQGATARDIMSRQVISVTPETDVAEVQRLFVNERIRRVPVLDGGRLVGIVSRGDLLHPERLSHTLEVVQVSSLTTGPLDIVQQASEESFPASDPPTWSQSRRDPDEPSQ